MLIVSVSGDVIVCDAAVEDSCKWCCMNTSTDDHTCRPYQLTDNSTLPDRTPCVQGYCLEVTVMSLGY